ncbi:hypothetical protein BBMN23_0212 [Bifidobacterium adolescentis]|nr:hypothetical protein BBMN23_0212 [Bifidobacterium adolescentis]
MRPSVCHIGRRFQSTLSYATAGYAHRPRVPVARVFCSPPERVCGENQSFTRLMVR